MKAQDDGLVKVQPLLDRFGGWPALLASGLSEEDGERIRSHERTGRPLGPAAFVDRLERLLRRTLKSQTRGPKPRARRPEMGRTSRSAISALRARSRDEKQEGGADGLRRPSDNAVARKRPRAFRSWVVGEARIAN